MILAKTCKIFMEGGWNGINLNMNMKRVASIHPHKPIMWNNALQYYAKCCIAKKHIPTFYQNQFPTFPRRHGFRKMYNMSVVFNLCSFVQPLFSCFQIKKLFHDKIWVSCKNIWIGSNVKRFRRGIFPPKLGNHALAPGGDLIWCLAWRKGRLRGCWNNPNSANPVF